MHNKIFLTLIPLLLTWARLSAQPSYAEHSRLAEGTWFKMAIATDGIYKLTGSDIAALNGVNCNQISIFGSAGDMLVEDNRVAKDDDLEPIAIEIVDHNGNDIIDADDYILFYGESPNVWRYNAQSQHFEFKPHAYANTNFYFLTTTCDALDPSMRIAEQNIASTSSSTISTYTAVALYHPDNINTHGGGQIWVADKFSSGNTTRNYTLSLPSSPLEGTVHVRYALSNISNYGAQFTLRCGNNQQQQYLSSSATYQTFRETWNSLYNKDIQVNLSYAPQASTAEGYLDYFELNALAPMDYNGGQQTIRNSQMIGYDVVNQFQITSNSNNLKLWNIGTPCQPYAATLTNVGGNNYRFTAPGSNANIFIAFCDADAMKPQSIEAIENQDLHGAQLPDYVIVAHKDFVQQAEALAELHRTHDGLKVLVVNQEQVFNEYSSGKQDPIAIRQMMRRFRNMDSTGLNPRYLLLFGKGTYDNRDILGKHQRTVVTYQTPTSFDSEGAAFPSDDVYGYLGNDIGGVFEGKMTVSIGRLPANNVAEAEHYVNKIGRYMMRKDFENEEIRGDWRNYIALLADDADPSCPYDTTFASDSEKMARLINQQYPHFNIDKIYADSYIQQSGADGSYYPDVNNALRQRLNYGCLVLNYIGHGSSSYIGTERFMEFTDIEKYTNSDRLPLFITSTCSFGHYDLIEDICGSEAFMLAENAGIGVIAAARPIHHNQQFNTNTCLFALNPENTIGDALRKAKNITQVSHCINLIGDPALHLSIPQNRVVVTAINDNPVNPEVTDSAEVLSRVTVEGEIQGVDGTVLTDFNGIIYPIVFDREVACQTLANDNDSTQVNFVQQKSMLYKGRETVENGRFSYSFIIPRDVAYRYDYAKLSHYAKSATDNATGQYGNIMFGGFNEDMEIIEQHPTVQLFINDTNFRNGGLTSEMPTLYARLIDSVGINAAGSGLGHDITAIIDGNPYSTVKLNDYYEPDIRDSRNGEVYYTLGKLEDGQHTLTVKCWNIYNYSGSATISFVVGNDRVAQLGQLTASPNPAHDRTLIRLEHNLTSNIADATIAIYDMRGSLVKEYKPTLSGSTCVVAFPWDFRAENGSQVSRGIYIVRGTITTADGERLTQTTKIVKN